MKLSELGGGVAEAVPPPAPDAAAPLKLSQIGGEQPKPQKLSEVSAPAPMKLSQINAPAEPEKPGIGRTLGQAARDFASPFVESGQALGEHFGQAFPSADQERETAKKPFMERMGAEGERLMAGPKMLMDVLGLGGAPVTGAARATVGRAATALPQYQGPEGEQKAMSAVDLALLGMRPAKGGALPRGGGGGGGGGGGPSEPPPPPPFKPSEVSETAPKPVDPGTILEAPPGVESPKQAAIRIDDALYRLRTNASADKIEAADFLKTVPKEQLDPAFQERAYAEMEARMVDPKVPLSPEVEQFYETTLKPMREEEAANYAEIKKRMGGDYDEEIPDYPGYVSRRVKGKNTMYDAADPENFAQHNPVTGARGPSGKNLSTFSPSQMGRKFFVKESPTGEREFLKEPPEGAAHGAETEGGTLKHATSEEVERNTMRERKDPMTGEVIDEVPGTQYYKNPLVNTIDNVLSQRRVIRNLDMLDDMKSQLSASGQAFQATPGRNARAPEGFIETTLPQLKGWKFHPKIANVLNDFHGEALRGGSLDQALTKANRFLTSTIFFNPVPHTLNVATHWVPARGFDWVRPAGMKSLFVDGAKAIQEVATQGPLYREMLREGAPLLYGDVANANFHKLMLEKMFNEQMKDPQTWGGIAKTLGFKTVKDLVKAEYRASAKALWAGSDMFMMQRILELERQGMPRREAIHAASRDVPSYRVPSEVMGSRAMAELLKNDRYLMFGRYKYGQFKAYAEMAKDLIGKGTDRFGRPLSESVLRHLQREAAGKLMVLALMGTVAYPLADKAVQMASGNDEGQMKRSGPMSPIQGLAELTDGQRDWVGAVSSIITPSPVVRGIAEATTNKDVFGRSIIEPKASGLGQAVEGGEFATSQLGPGQTALRTAKQGPSAAIAELLGVKLPTDEQKIGKLKGQKMSRGQAKSREKHDDIEQAVRDVLGQ